MAIISENPDGFDDEDPNKKPQELDKKPKEEENRSICFPIPEVLTEICIALVLRRDYPTISCFSSYFRTLIASSRLYETRSKLGLTECYLYAIVALPLDFPRWHILHRNKMSDLTLTKLDSIPCVPSGAAVVTVGTEIYVIGGKIDCLTTSCASVIDCRTHERRQLQSMTRRRFRAAAGVIDGKIYVLGGCEKLPSESERIDVFDLEKQSWESLPAPYHYSELKGEIATTFAVMEEKFYVLSLNRCFVYEPKREGRRHTCTLTINNTGIDEFLWWNLWQESCCVVDDMLYAFDPRRLRHPLIVFDPKDNTWRPVSFEPSENIYSFSRVYDESRVTNFGGKIVILGCRKSCISSGYPNGNGIWCIKIALERREDGQIWGKVESSDWVHKLLSCFRYPLSFVELLPFDDTWGWFLVGEEGFLLHVLFKQLVDYPRANIWCL